MSANYYKMGSANYACRRCDQKYKREDMRKEWTGLVVCYNCYDPRHPETLPLPSVVDGHAIRDTSPRSNGVDVNPKQHMGVWGEYYLTRTGFVSDLKWEGWNVRWGTQDSVPFTAENFPLL